ncbi:unnamed protein product [Bursaphelenchus okinawaensis]|uniref:G-protein coupled receptors family 1 profile domain-containing protein n=1 Tax=Bursaphelenchus okinawaensis TaxID=465554 RepID=A0A811L4L8_9BILA|nr:unnamed protein product [Bursaphelenchus okinawaensis]CAG9117194.1 unnamed protein product [Bursaphelenchus okinawaensis]
MDSSVIHQYHELANMSQTIADDQPICGEYEQYTLIRFVLLSCASIVAMAGIVCNAFLVLFFTTRKLPNTPPTLYPGVLAMLDWCMCVMYIALFGTDAAVVYLNSKTLFLIYHAYVVPAFVVARITQIAIPYMLIFATLERYVWITSPLANNILKTMFSRRGRHVTMVVTMIICILLRLPLGWSIIVYEFPSCPDFFRTKMANVAEWASESYAYHVYDFHILGIAQTFVPFVVLVVLNIMVVRKMIRVRSQSCATSARMSLSVEASTPFYASPTPSEGAKAELATNGGFASLIVPQYAYRQNSIGNGNYDMGSFNRPMSRRTDRAVRAAIYTMLGIVTSYLVSNSLHLVLTILERSGSPLLIDVEDPARASSFHTYFSDMVSFVYMFTSAVRILIYVICNPAIRKDIAKLLRDTFGKFRKVQSKQNGDGPTML